MDAHGCEPLGTVASTVSDRTLLQSRYDRSATRIGVVHLGVGAFHRAHQAWYFDALMDATGDLSWAIAGVNLRAAQSRDIARLRRSAGQYVVKTLAADGGAGYRLIRSHKAFFDWTVDPESAEDVVSWPSVQVISMTVTESGYCLDDNGELDLADSGIRAELAGGSPGTVYAYLKRALERRMEAGTGGLTIMCCDNLRENGRVLRRAFLSYLEAAGDDALAAWLADNASFPCSMVDRITPRPDPRNAAEVAEVFGIEDDPTIHAEDFVQWVIEDDFRGVRPELAAAGAQLVNDVEPYEQAKIRILNGGHTGLVYLGALHGYTHFDAALRDPRLREFFDCFETREVIPSLDAAMPVDLDLSEYFRTVRARFLNAYIADRIERIAMDGVSKFPVFVVPTVRACFVKGIEPVHAMRAIASWYVFMRHVQSGEIGFRYVEPRWSAVRDLLAPGREEDFARHPDVWADTAVANPGFVRGVCSEIAALSARFPAR